MLQINEKLIGQTFTALDPNLEYTCVGFANTQTLLIIGADNDTVNNRFKLKTFKITDVTFKGQF